MIRTLMPRIWRYFTFKDTERYVDVLPDFHYPTMQHETKSSPTAIAQPTRDCAANPSSLSNSVVQLTARHKQIFLPPVTFFRNASDFESVCFLKVLSGLSLHHVRQTAVSNLCSRTSFRLSQHEKFLVVYLGNEMSLTVYLSTTDSFFLRRSQRKRLIYVDAIFVSVVTPMLYTGLGLFRLNRWQLHNFHFP